MSFLFPLYLLAAAAVAAPIWFHLRSRRPPRQQVFPSLMFLQPQKEPLQRRRRPQDWLLLLVRCLALVVLALLFARPWLAGGDDEADDGMDGRVVAVLVDASASMQRDDLWPRALAKARRALQQAQGSGGNQVWLGLYGRGPGVEWLHQPQPVASAAGPAESPGGVRPPDWAALLQGLQAGWGGTGLVAAMQQTVETLEAGRGPGAGEEGQAIAAGVAHARLVVISDFQEGEDWERLGQWSWPAEVELQVVPVAPGEGDARRVSLHGVPELMEDELGEPDPASLAPMVRLTASADRADGAAPLPARLFWADEPAAGEVHSLAPGASRVVHAPSRGGGATGPAELRLGGDGAVDGGTEPAFDQRLFVADRAPRDLRVLWWSANDQAGQTDGEGEIDSGFFLRQALIDSARNRWTLEGWQPPAAVPAGTDAVVVAGQLSMDAASALAAYVGQGGTVVGLPAAGAAAGWSLVLAAEAEHELAGDSTPRGLLWVDQAWQHPVLRPFAVAGANDFSRIRFWHHRILPVTPEARVLARFDSGQPALVEVPQGDGRWFLLASGWAPEDSQLGVASKFLPLLHGMLLSGTREGGASMLRAGEAAPWPGIWRTPDGAVVELSADPERRMELVLAVPGLYGWRATPATDEVVVAVNVEPRESELRPLGHGELQDLGLPLTQVAGGVAADGRAGAESGGPARPGEVVEQQQQLWRWLLVGLLALLLLELWLASRPRPPQETGEAVA